MVIITLSKLALVRPRELEAEPGGSLCCSSGSCRWNELCTGEGKRQRESLCCSSGSCRWNEVRARGRGRACAVAQGS